MFPRHRLTPGRVLLDKCSSQIYLSSLGPCGRYSRKVSTFVEYSFSQWSLPCGNITIEMDAKCVPEKTVVLVSCSEVSGRLTVFAISACHVVSNRLLYFIYDLGIFKVYSFSVFSFQFLLFIAWKLRINKLTLEIRCKRKTYYEYHQPMRVKLKNYLLKLAIKYLHETLTFIFFIFFIKFLNFFQLFCILIPLE